MTDIRYLQRLEAVLTDAIDATSRPTARRRKTAARVAIAAGALALGVILALGTPTSAPPAAAIDVIAEDGYVTILLREIEADPAETQRQIRAAGLNVELLPVPASPTAVGRLGGILRAEGGAQDVTLVDSDGTTARGIRIAKGSTQRIEIQIGRRARPTESYQITGDPYKPGEPLGCTNLYGKKVADAKPTLDRLGLTISWQRYDPTSGQMVRVSQSDVLDEFITDAFSHSPTHLTIYTNGIPRSPLLNPPSHPNKYPC